MLSLKYAKVIWEDFVSLVYPEICIHCSDNLVKNERYLCTRCYTSLPITNYHNKAQNPVYQHFAYLPKVSMAAAYLKFHKSGVAQNILHQLKYEGEKDLGKLVGEWYGTHLKQKLPSEGSFLPVPIHKSKLKKRGFNQSNVIAEGLSTQTGIPILENAVERKWETASQTNKSKVARWKNLQSVYEITNIEVLQQAKVIIVDDVITTGATIGSLCDLIHPYVEEIVVLSIATGK